MQGPQKLALQRKQPPRRGMNVLTAGKPTLAVVQLSSVSNFTAPAKSPHLQRTTVKAKEVIWHPSTPPKSQISSRICSQTQRLGLGLEVSTGTTTDCGNGRTVPSLTFPTGVQTSLMVENTSSFWVEMGNGEIGQRVVSRTTSVRLPFSWALFCL